MKKILDNKIILITGGTGSFGKKFIEIVLKKFKPKKIIIYSRDELKQFEMQNNISQEKKNIFRFFIGDVRDLARLKTAMENVDAVIHAAALKQVPTAEYNPFEAVKTNIMGAQNVIDAAISTGVKRIIALSTDKAAAPINLYGATKLTSDKLFVAANNFVGSHAIKFSVVRYGNVMGSRGSVIPIFLQKKASGELPITDKKMTRFSITLDEGVNFVLYCLEVMVGGEIFVPKIPSLRIIDIAKAIAPKARFKVVGMRPGEKLHEEMITESDTINTLEFNNYYSIIPNNQFINQAKKKKFFKYKNQKGKKCPVGFRYDSLTNKHFLTVSNIQKLIAQHLKFPKK